MKYFLKHFNFKIIKRKANFFLISFNKGKKDEIKLKLKSKNKFLALNSKIIKFYNKLINYFFGLNNKNR
jgi:hypothetical protein